jgi:hypothetical protein
VSLIGSAGDWGAGGNLTLYENVIGVTMLCVPP